MKKTLSLFLSIFMLFTTTGITSYADSDTQAITAYVTVCKYGEIVTDKNGNLTAAVAVELDGQDTYTLDDVLTEFHNNCYDGGADAGYSTDTGNYGLYVAKFWGDTTGNFLYFINGNYAMGPEDKISDGDRIEFSVNENTTYANLEKHSKFDTVSDSIFVNDTKTLTLSFESKFDNGSPVYEKCKDAIITINGIETETKTDENGQAEISFDTVGTYVVSAKKSQTIEVADSDPITTTAIIAPYAIIRAMALPETMTHNIAEYYSENGIAEDENNIYWFAADFADYSTAYPDSEYVLSATEKQACVDKLIEKSNTSTSQGDLAKCIIALRAMGYDPKNTYTANGDSLDIVAKLNSLITTDSVNAPYYEYTLPYVLIALDEGEGYAEEGKLEILLDYASSETGKAAWQDTTWGIDGVTPMLLALSHYKDNDGVKDLIKEATTHTKNAQASDGSFGNAASTGLAIAGLCAVGEDVKTLVKDGSDKNALFALMTYANDTYTMFKPVSNTFSTEQGFRGLVALKLAENNKIMYDFKNNPTNEARATLTPTPTPTRKPSGGGGSYTPKATPTPTVAPTAAPSGLPDKNEDVKVNEIINKDKTFEDIKDCKNKNAIEELAARSIIDGIDDDTYEPDSGMTRAQFAAIAVRALGLPEKNGFDFEDVSETDWFYSYVNTAYAYGIIDGVSDTEFNPNGKITREEAATMTARAAKLCGMKIALTDDGIRNILAEFTDYTTVSDWAAESVAFCYSENILDNSVLEIKPKEEITRAEMAQMIYNMLEKAKLI